MKTPYDKLAKIYTKHFGHMNFNLSAKVTHLTYLNIVFSKTTRSIELKFHMTTPYDWLVKVCTNCYGHMT